LLGMSLDLSVLSTKKTNKQTKNNQKKKQTNKQTKTKKRRRYNKFIILIRLSKEQPKSVNQSTGNAIEKGENKTMIYKTLHGKDNLEQHEPHYIYKARHGPSCPE